MTPTFHYMCVVHSKRTANALSFALASAALAGCTEDSNHAGFALTQEAAQEVAVVRLVNDPAVTFEVLDDDVSLDRRAARNLIAHRAGPDGFYGTRDDNAFDDLAEVDSVSYVGASALRKLLAYAEANGYLPSSEDVLGTFDGVAFTFGEAERVLALCNEASEGVLDAEVDLDRRAVRSILDARPIADMSELAGLYYVGGSALGKLRDFVEEPAAGERADCRHNGECGGDEFCEGIPFDGSSEYGKCRPRSTAPGAGNSCDEVTPCGSELFCGGLTMWSTGMCIADWQHDTFENTTQRFISQDQGEVVATSVTVRGQASVPFDIVASVDLAHDAPESLRIVLLDPNGTDAVLWDGPSEGGRTFPDSFVALGNISRDDVVNGRWLLQVTNVDGQGVGNLHGWTLWLSSNFD